MHLFDQFDKHLMWIYIISYIYPLLLKPWDYPTFPPLFVAVINNISSIGRNEYYVLIQCRVLHLVIATL